jgi:hypothetical protein
VERGGGDRIPLGVGDELPYPLTYGCCLMSTHMPPCPLGAGLACHRRGGGDGMRGGGLDRVPVLHRAPCRD